MITENRIMRLVVHPCFAILCLQSALILGGCEKIEGIYYVTELRSNDKQRVLEALNHFRDRMNRAYLKDIVALYFETTDFQVKTVAFEVSITVGAMKVVASPPGTIGHEVSEIDSSILALFKDAIVSDSQRLRMSAIYEIGHLKLSSFLPEVTDRLADKERDVRAEASRVLGIIGNKESIPALIDVAISDTSYVVPNYALKSIGKLGNATTLEYLRENYERFPPRQYEYLDEAIRRIQDKVDRSSKI